jgi:hypothetical protein
MVQSFGLLDENIPRVESVAQRGVSNKRTGTTG